MKINTFSVTNYRSITRAHKIKLHDLTILVGKNNEGKSNIIKALSLSMNIFGNGRLIRNRMIPSLLDSHSYADRIIGYRWDRDFPIDKVGGSKTTKFELEFQLTDEEIKKFNKKVGTRLGTPNFDVTIEIGENNIPVIKAMKKGSSIIKNKSREISEFIYENMVFNYIPAIRTETQAIELIQDTLSQELKVLETDQKYIDAINTISELQKEPLNKIAEKVKNTLSEFIPTIDDVKVEIEENMRRYSLRRSVNVFINDGTLTNIAYKGDGIKSLATLAMLTDRYNTEQSSIIAIDEPEAHLHPGSIRQLNNILQGLVSNNQVIIATHNPLFINKSDIKSNIIVSAGKASPAKSIKEIRDTLGVELADNLISCDFKIFVEGLSDKRIINAILCHDKEIRTAINNSEVCIESLRGASSLSSKIYESHNNIFKYYAFLDNDVAGREAYNDAVNKNLIKLSQVTFTTCIGKQNSELEDLIVPEIYLHDLNEAFGLNLTKSNFNSMKKWSDQLKELFLSNGKMWNSEIEDYAKTIVADQVCKNIDDGNDVLIPERRASVDNFIMNIKNIIKSSNEE